MISKTVKRRLQLIDLLCSYDDEYSMLVKRLQTSRLSITEFADDAADLQDTFARRIERLFNGRTANGKKKVR